MIHVEELTKRFGNHTAVDAVSFRAGQGQVTGFLGPNGAGKTTTMRMMVGLTKPTAGSVHIGGVRYVDLPNPARRVGVLLDASAQHAGRTGREVLAVAAGLIGLDRRRVDEMLDVVGLTAEEGGRRVREYSLGMRQRLGVAHAMLGDPEVLILDEPANGLDPAGIRWMRDLLKAYADRGGTVLLSSHLLHEVQQVADHIVMIGGGRIVADGSFEDLLAGGATFVRGDDQARLGELLAGAGLEARAADGGLTVKADAAEVAGIAASGGVSLLELRAAQDGLEELFMRLTAASQRDAAQDGGPA